MNNYQSTLLKICSVMITVNMLFAFTLAQSAQFSWPQGKKIALSLSFDDARNSQVEGGTALLDKYGVKATFYVVPSAVEKRLEGWKKSCCQWARNCESFFESPVFREFFMVA